MLREFFFRRENGRAWPFLGLGLVLGHGVLRAYVKFRLNDFYARFYDVAGAADFGSGFGDADSDADGRRRITNLLLEFAALCLPNVVLHPVYKLVSNRWVLSWRLALIRDYLEKWRRDGPSIENGAQRVHEDTARFARGLHTCFGVVLDSALTLFAFCPLLLELGGEVQPAELPRAWLLLLCGGVAAVGVAGSAFLGFGLIELEVQNQKSEADLRRKLVLFEEKPADAGWEALAHNDAQTADPSASPLPEFQLVIFRLAANYTRLYASFCTFGIWLASYEQSVTLLPYFIAAPMLYSSDPARRLSLGAMTKLANAFSQVFSSLNLVSDNWLEITDFLSVVRRLREFESLLRPTPARGTLMHGTRARSTELSESV